jgi:hypothetical protein
MRIALAADASGTQLAPFRSGSRLVLGEVIDGKVASRTLSGDIDCCEDLCAAAAGCQSVLCAGITEANARRLAGQGVEVVSAVLAEGERWTIDDVISAYDQGLVRVVEPGCGEAQAEGCGGQQGCCGRHHH